MASKPQIPKTKNGLIIPEGVIFYYVRNKNGQPFACVAIADNGEGQYCRGVSICSGGDQFSKKVGRNLAFGRLCKAFGTGRSADPILNYVFTDQAQYISLSKAGPTAVFDVAGRPVIVDLQRNAILCYFEEKTRIGYKTGYDVLLTKLERQLVEKTKPKEAAACSTS